MPTEERFNQVVDPLIEALTDAESFFLIVIDQDEHSVSVGTNMHQEIAIALLEELINRMRAGVEVKMRWPQ